MNRELEQYRFARIEGHRITRARLEAQFKDGIMNLDDLENAIAHQLTTDQPCAPWRKSEGEQAGCRDGRQLAALEFFWEHRHNLRPAIADRSSV